MEGTLQNIIDGYRRFRTITWPARRALHEQLARDGQSPWAMVIACADSRIDPEVILDAGPGELFVVRNVANLVPPFAPDAAYHGTSAALEFAVQVLNVPLIIVLGHTGCGGVAALLNGAPKEAKDFLTPWMQIAEPARCRVIAAHHQDRAEACEKESIKLSLEHLQTFPWIASRISSRELCIHGALFNTKHGTLELMSGDGAFVPIADSQPVK